MANDARRVIINYRKVNPNKLGDWLEENNYIYSFIPYDPDPDSDKIGDLRLYVEVYSEEAELALRLKYDVEE